MAPTSDLLDLCGLAELDTSEGEQGQIGLEQLGETSLHTKYLG